MNYSSSYIQQLPIADYEQVSSAPLSESSNTGLAGPLDSILNVLPGGRGRVFTTAINAAGFSTNPAGLNAAYKSHKQAINEYLQYINVDKILQQALSPSQLKPFLPGFIAGIGVSAVGIFLFHKINH